MRVIVHLTFDGDRELRLVGEAPIFGDIDYRKGFDGRLRDLGFWLSDWKYAGHGGPSNKSRVFIPWASALMIEEVA